MMSEDSTPPPAPPLEVYPPQTKSPADAEQVELEVAAENKIIAKVWAWSEIAVTQDSSLIDLLKWRSYSLVSGLLHKPDDLRSSADKLVSESGMEKAAAPLCDLGNIAALAFYEQEPLSFAEGKKMFLLMDKDGDGDLTMEEIQAAVERDDVKEFIQGHPALLMLQDPATVEKLFKTPALEETKGTDQLVGSVQETKGTDQLVESVTMEGWMNMLGSLIDQQCKYVRRLGQIGGQSFWGRSLEAEDQYACCPDSWAADLWYFFKNNHSLARICLKDAEHPLNKYECINIQFAVLGWNLFFSALISRSKDPVEKFIVGLFAVAIPSSIISMFLTYIHGCPCLLTQYKKQGCCACCTKCLRGVGACVGCLVFLIAIGFFAVGVLICIENIDKDLGSGFDFWALNTAEGWVLAPIIWMSLSFNPLGAALCLRDCCCCGTLFGLAGLAQWQVERRQVKDFLFELAKAEALANQSATPSAPGVTHSAPGTVSEQPSSVTPPPPIPPAVETTTAPPPPTPPAAETTTTAPPPPTPPAADTTTTSPPPPPVADTTTTV
jgi:hypothetical protein